jgi:cbb3-type cytochrome oxidase maturation protein
MEAIFVALPVALLVAGSAIAAFIWAAKRDQFDDLDGPPRRILLDDEPVAVESRRKDESSDGAGRATR